MKVCCRLLLLMIFMVTVTVLYHGRSNAEPRSGKVEQKEPTLEDVYRLLQEIKAKLEEKGTQEVNRPPGINITGWSLYVAWGVPTLHHVTIENTSDVAYKDVEIKANYYYSYSTDFGRSETGEVEGTLPVTLPPRSKETYFKKGILLERASAASMYGGPKDIEVITATPVIGSADFFSSR
ncbi:MAG: hypothetical protein ACREOB_02075 [Thermodesulfobacteriota bacterium]